MFFHVHIFLLSQRANNEKYNVVFDFLLFVFSIVITEIFCDSVIIKTLLDSLHAFVLFTGMTNRSIYTYHRSALEFQVLMFIKKKKKKASIEGYNVPFDVFYFVVCFHLKFIYLV